MFVDILLQHCPDFASAKYSQCIMGKSKIEAYVIGRLKSGSTPSLKWVNVEENEFSIRLVNHNNRKWKKEDGDLIEVCHVRTCTNADFRSKVSSKFTLSLLVNNELYVSLWARPISLIYDGQHSKIYHVNCLFNPFLMKHFIFVSDS